MNGAETFERVVDDVARGETVALATVVAGPSIGTKVLVRGDGSLEGTTGDAALDATLVERGREAMRSGRTARFEAGESTIYVEPYAPPISLVVCGAGHIAVPLAAMAKVAGFHVTVIDDRADYASPKRFPTADDVVADDFAAALGHIRITAATAIVLVTRGHRQDWDCLRVVVDSAAGYIGMIGSRRRVKAALMGLEAEGFSAERLACVAAPIGLDIGSETPAEIAVAILAEIVLARRGGTGRPLHVAR